MTKTESINPCPFCGTADPTFVETLSQADCSTLYQVYCTACYALGPTKHNSDDAVKAWNHHARLKINSMWMVMDIQYSLPVKQYVLQRVHGCGDKTEIKLGDLLVSPACKMEVK